MNPTDALAILKGLGVPALATADAAAALGLTSAAASQTLTRLSRAGLVRSIRHGTWWLDDTLDPLRLPEYLTAPLPAYVSLQTALHRHGLIEQIPDVVYAITLARTQKVTTSVGTCSLHHMAPEVFGGFEETARGAKVATAEKALFDFAYLSSGRSRLFTSLPELELPHRFKRKELDRWVTRIPSLRSRTLTSQKLEELLGKASAVRDTRGLT